GQRQADPAVVRRLGGRMDGLLGLLSERAARGLCLRGLDDTARCPAPGVSACRAPRGLARLPADHCRERLETARRRAADRAHPALARGDHRTALFPALDDHAALAGLVLAPLPAR